MLFKEDDYGRTPFQMACNNSGHDKVVINDTLLIRCWGNDTKNTPPINIVKVLVMAVNVDECIHLDCIYFLLRREPDILQKTSIKLQQ